LSNPNKVRLLGKEEIKQLIGRMIFS